MPDLLSTSVSALQAFQRVIATTGHNVANAQTEGFTRQRVDLAARPPQQLGGNFIGAGVEVSGVDRVYDQFLVQQLRDNATQLSRLETFQAMASRVDNLFGDASTGLAPVMQAFFGAVQEVADDPASIPAREVLLTSADTLRERFTALDRRLSELDREVAFRVEDSVSTINGLTASIADLNGQIIAVNQASGGQPPNDLLDQRDLAIRQLSEQIGVGTTTQSDGSVNVFIASGEALVFGDQATTLGTVPGSNDPTAVDVVLHDDVRSIVVTGTLGGGQLGGALDFRRDMLNPVRNALGRVATGLVHSFNDQHREGMDLNGQLGGDFFSIASPRVVLDANNAGSGSAAVTVADVAALTESDYQLRFDGSAYTLFRNDTGTVVPMSGSGTAVDPFVADGLSIEVTPGAVAGDVFAIYPTREVASSLQGLLGRSQDIAAAVPIRTSAATTNQSDAEIDAGQVLDVTDPALLNPVTIEFLNTGTYSINGAGSFIYSDGAPIDINGARVTISGSPEAGDQFTIEANSGGIGDNRNALSLGELQTRGVLDGGSTGLTTGYSRLLAQVGSTTNQVNVSLDAQSLLAERAEEAFQSISGVNLDEEAANLLRFQQAYQAAAQMITVADNLFQTLLGAVRR